jgi:serine phosphatase RsbU (regulator of sigma subunit)
LISLYDNAKQCRPATSELFFRGSVIATWNMPANNARVGGDWSEVFPISERILALSMGDACGHGVGAYNEMLAIREAIARAAYTSLNPTEILIKANRTAYRRRHAGPVTAIIALLDTASNTLTIGNAGHSVPFILGPAGRLLAARSPGDLPLGIFAEHTSTSYVVPVPPDTLVVLYTDGISEHARDGMKGEEDLRTAATYAYEHPHSSPNAAELIAQQILPNLCLSDDAAIITVRTRLARVEPAQARVDDSSCNARG